ncbi:LuxR C-terminal-related transcriptional regulator [Spirosoma montaniterrae]|uniref:HTH luxR-type domain-containing protein n=1 Tax=Spirosoma montaniterrae TaxID=1178516 RepID=A0A1P9WY48_9BACT|nr:LuxR C-terminal-related transcriptional regulator [Spirosoma montaniterrae]AQG80305.1 hypothetical protein AWR27_13840 [Spirosoma montaniterrae]
MKKAMTPEELLKAENAFIRLHNQVRASSEDDAKDEEPQALRNLTNREREVMVLIARDMSTAEIAQKLSVSESTINSQRRNLMQKLDVRSNVGIAHFAFKYGLIDPPINLIIDRSTINLIIDGSTLLASESQDHFENLKDCLPNSIKRIKIVNYQDLRNVELVDIPIDSKWIFLAGQNGYGKTSLLRSVVLGLFGSHDEGVMLVESAKTKVGLEYKNDFSNIINNLWTPDFRPLEHLACYGPSRLQIQSKMSQNEVAEKSTTTYGLFNPDGILLNIETKLIEWHLEKNEQLNQVKTLFREVIPALADIIIQKNEQDDYEVLYVERAEDGEGTTFDPVPFEKLAAGFRSIIGLIGDLLIRFIRKQPDVKQLSDLAGIVLIDELENHLHPKWQYQLPTLLSKAFPNIQFIAATHSVIPILGAPKNSVFLKLNRSKEKGITVERIDIDVANLLPNSILTSPIFDMETIRPIANEDVGLLRTEDTYTEVVANDEIDKQLRELAKDPSQYPPLLQE